MKDVLPMSRPPINREMVAKNASVGQYELMHLNPYMTIHI